MWCYPLGLFVSALGFNTEVTGYTLCLRISPKQRLDRGRALVWNRGALRPPIFRFFCPCTTSVRSGKSKLEGNKLRLSQSLADIAPSSIGWKFGVILRQPRIPSQTAPRNRTDDVWSSVVISAKKLSSSTISCGTWFVVGYLLFWSAGCGTPRSRSVHGVA